MPRVTQPRRGRVEAARPELSDLPDPFFRRLLSGELGGGDAGERNAATIGGARCGLINGAQIIEWPFNRDTPLRTA